MGQEGDNMGLLEQDYSLEISWPESPLFWEGLVVKRGKNNARSLSLRGPQGSAEPTGTCMALMSNIPSRVGKPWDGFSYTRGPGGTATGC